MSNADNGVARLSFWLWHWEVVSRQPRHVYVESHSDDDSDGEGDGDVQ